MQRIMGFMLRVQGSLGLTEEEITRLPSGPTREISDLPSSSPHVEITQWESLEDEVRKAKERKTIPLLLIGTWEQLEEAVQLKRSSPELVEGVVIKVSKNVREELKVYQEELLDAQSAKKINKRRDEEPIDLDPPKEAPTNGDGVNGHSNGKAGWATRFGKFASRFKFWRKEKN